MDAADRGPVDVEASKPTIVSHPAESTNTQDSEKPVYGLLHRRLIYACAFSSIACHGGVVYGWPSMRTIFLRDEVLLAPECMAVNRTQLLCAQQELDFGVIYTVGSWSNQASRLLIGVMLDSLGPRAAGSFSAAVFSVGAAIFASATSSDVGLACGFLLIGGGGAGIQLSVQSVAALFPHHRSTAMACLSGAYQLATVVYLLFEVLHREGVPFQAMILFQCGLAALTSVLLLLLPDRPFGIATKRGSGRLRAAWKTWRHRPTPARQNDSRSSAEPLPTPALDTSGGGPILRQQTFWRQATSAESILLHAYFSIGMVQCQFTVASMGAQLEGKGDVDGDATRYFGALLAAACLWAPVLGMLTDRIGFWFTLTLGNTLLLVSCLCLLIPSLPLTYFGSLAYAIGRVTLWALYFAYMAHVFGFRHFGKLAGCGMTLAACLSLLQYPLLYLCVQVLDGRFVVANSIFVGLHILAYGTLPRLARGARAASRIPKQ